MGDKKRREAGLPNLILKEGIDTHLPLLVKKGYDIFCVIAKMFAIVYDLDKDIWGYCLFVAEYDILSNNWINSKIK